MKILIYVIIAVVGFILGQFVDWCNIRFAEEKKILSKDIKEYIKKIKINYPICIINMFLYLILFYEFGFSLIFFKYAFLGTCLICAFVIDYYLTIIPNKLNLTILIGGIIFAIIGQAFNMSSLKDLIFGMLTRWRIFLINNLSWWVDCRKRSNGPR